MPQQSICKRGFQIINGATLWVSACSFLLLTGTHMASATENGPIGIFRVLSNDELGSVEPALREKYFKNGDPDNYRRHRLLRINTEKFRILLERDYSLRREKIPSPGVQIPLFDDYLITVRIDSWIDGNFGVTSVFGSTIESSSLGGSFNAQFSDGDRLQASVATKDAAFLIAFVSDYAHYVVFEFDPMGVID